MRKTIALLMSALLLQLQLAPVWAAAEASGVESVEMTENGVVITTDQPVQYDSFATAEPPRVILELLNARMKGEEKKLEGAGLLKAVRAEQYQKTPLSIVRVVLQLGAKAEYSVSSSGNVIKIQLKPVGGGAAQPRTGADEVSSGQPGQAAALQPEPAAAAATMPPGPDYGPQKRAAYRDILATLPKYPVTLDYDDSAEVRDVLGELAARAGLNLIFADEVSGNVAVHLVKVPFDEAFSAVLSLRGLAIQQIGSNILRVTTSQAITAEKTTGAQVTKVFPLNFIKAADAKLMLAGVITAEGRTGAVTVDPVNNMLIVTDIASGIDTAGRILSQIDRKPMQVLIETKIVEVNLNDSSAFGIDWNFTGVTSANYGSAAGLNFFGASNATAGGGTYTSPDGVVHNLPVNTNSGSGFGVLNPTPANQATSGFFNFGHITNDYIFRVSLNAALQKGKAKVLSDPKVTTFNNMEAKINITTQIPYVNTTITNATPPIINTTVNWIDTGITLKVTPQVNADGKIAMKLNPSVSQVASTVPTASGAPGVDTRSADTTVMAKDGDTIVIGGLIYDNASDTVYKVPVLGDIPLLGWFFKKKATTRQRVELLIFVTPRIVES